MSRNLIEAPLPRNQEIVDPNHLTEKERMEWFDTFEGKFHYESEILDEYAERHGVTRDKVRVSNNGLLFIDK